MPWAVAYVAPNTELRLRDWLTERSEVCYVPTGKHRLKTRHKRKPVEIDRVVFGCYVFMFEPINWGLLRQSPPGMRRMLQFDGEILCVRDVEIDRLKIMQSKGHFDNLKDPIELRFAIGDDCDIIGGAFIGQVARVEKHLKSMNGMIEVTVGRLRVKIPAFFLRRKERS